MFQSFVNVRLFSKFLLIQPISRVAEVIWEGKSFNPELEGNHVFLFGGRLTQTATVLILMPKRLPKLKVTKKNILTESR